MEFTKPKILISKCLEFASCRYNGKIVKNKSIALLKKYINAITVCPETEIGMGTPRKPIKIIKEENKTILYQSETKIDFYKKMVDFSKTFSNKIDDLDGIILKSKSPSCAKKTAKHYKEINKLIPFKKSNGIFANQILKKFPLIPSEEETRLNNDFVKEHFYTAIFTIAEFKTIGSMKELYNFHSKHKYLLMSYNQILLKQMGGLAANHKNIKLKLILKKYYELLLKTLSKRIKCSSSINTQMHIFGYFKKELTNKEKAYFLDLLDGYKNKKILISTVNKTLYLWAIKFNNKYLLNQSYFNPFPNELIAKN